MSTGPHDTGTSRTGPSGAMLLLADSMDRAVAMLGRAVVMVTGCALLVLLFSNVVARYTMGGGFSFAQELPERLFPFFIMAGVALAAQHGGHMAVEALPEMLGRRGNQFIRVLAQLLVIAGNVLLVSISISVANISWVDVSPVLGMPASYSYLAIAGGAAAVVVATAALVIRLIVIGPEAMPTPTPEEIGQ